VAQRTHVEDFAALFNGAENLRINYRFESKSTLVCFNFRTNFVPNVFLLHAIFCYYQPEQLYVFCFVAA
jgi:hypothetical protein